MAGEFAASHPHSSSDGAQHGHMFDASDLPLGAGTAEALAAALRKAREAMPEHAAGGKLQQAERAAASAPASPKHADDRGAAHGRADNAVAAPKRRGLFGLFGGSRRWGDDAAEAAVEPESLHEVDSGPASAAALKAAAAGEAGEDAAAEVARECLRLERARGAQARRIVELEAEAAALREECAETAGEVDAIRQAYAEVRGEREEAAEQVEQLLDKYCDAVRDTAMLVARLERYRCVLLLALHACVI